MSTCLRRHSGFRCSDVVIRPRYARPDFQGKIEFVRSQFPPFFSRDLLRTGCGEKPAYPNREKTALLRVLPARSRPFFAGQIRIYRGLRGATSPAVRHRIIIGPSDAIAPGITHMQRGRLARAALLLWAAAPVVL